MSCSPYDLRDYLFEELTPAQRAEVRLHVKTCDPCSSELEALRYTHSALLELRDEDIPQRIGFVSDKVFEPSPVRRWFTGVWNSAARLGFISATVLSAAILVHALRPVQPPVIVHNPAQITAAEVDRRIHEAVTAAVNQAVAETEIRAQKRTTALLAVAEKHNREQIQALNAAYLENQVYLRNKNSMALVSQNYGGSR
jgi:anti-sigma factor RsiW